MVFTSSPRSSFSSLCWELEGERGRGRASGWKDRKEGRGNGEGKVLGYAVLFTVITPQILTLPLSLKLGGFLAEVESSEVFRLKE